MREVEMMRKYNYDHKKSHDLLEERFVKDLLKENKVLTRQLEYIRSGEYLNQLKFERNMLEDVVSKGEVSEVDKAFIDMTHRNTELLEENQKLKEKVRALNKGLRKVQERSINYKNRCFKLNKKIYELEEQLEDMTLCRDIASGHRQEVQDREALLLKHQEEFVDYLKKRLIEICEVIGTYGTNTDYLYGKKDILDEILEEHKEIIGGK